MPSRKRDARDAAYKGAQRSNDLKQEKRELSEHARASLEGFLRDVKKLNPEVLSAAVVDEVGALLAFTGEVFVSTEGEEFSLGTILMFIHGMAEAGSRFFGAGQVSSVHVNCDGGKWFVTKLGSGEEAGGLLGVKTTLEANLAAIMLDARKAAEKITTLMTETKSERMAYFEAPKKLSKLTAEDMATWWGLRFRRMEQQQKKKGANVREDRTREFFSIKDYWEEALRKVKKRR